MSRGTPSMIALLGLLAVAGYQNRDKIAEVLGGGKQEPGSGPDQNNQQGGQDGALGKLGGLLGGLNTMFQGIRFGVFGIIVTGLVMTVISPVIAVFYLGVLPGRLISISAAAVAAIF